MASADARTLSFRLELDPSQNNALPSRALRFQSGTVSAVPTVLSAGRLRSENFTSLTTSALPRPQSVRACIH